MNPTENAEELIQTRNLIENIISVGNLLTTPRHAYIWFTLSIEEQIKRDDEDAALLEEGGLTVQELVEHTNIAQSTLYEDLGELEEIGAITAKSRTQPQTYSAEFLEVLAETPMKVEDGSVFITPAFIGAVGYGHIDDNVEVFLTRHGYGAFYLGLEVYTSIVRGDTSRDSVSELYPEVPESDLDMVKPAFKHALRERSRNPRHMEEYDI